jgi:gamma-glutamyltranspeptidase/glutathione hydrolase
MIIRHPAFGKVLNCMMQRAFFFIFSVLLFSCKTSKNHLASAGIDAYRYSTTKRVVAEKGAVVSAHPLASKVGVSVLKKGGNAVDAAIATQLALAVVYPNAGNIGGGGFMIARLHDGQTHALDFRETAPAEAHRDMYLNASGDVMEGKSVNGHLSSGVPGTVAGLFESLRYAKLSFRELITPAIELAENGFVITEKEARSLNDIQEDLHKYNSRVSVFQQKVWKTGDTLIQTDLATTLKRIRDGGLKGFYEGETADLIVAEMKRGGGILTLADLKNYRAIWRKPHAFTYKGYTIVSMPMPSSGGTLLHQMLKMVEDFPLPDYGFLSAEAVQLMTEAERRAYADRAEYMGDADFFHVPLEEITKDAYLKNRMKDYKPGVAGSSDRIKPGLLAPRESEQTTHLSVIDGEGNAVSVTTTLNNSYGSKTVVGGAGFFLNDEMDDFSVKPGVPNIYGAVGGEANAIAAGKRMLRSMTPTIVLQNGRPFLVAGTPGGTTIPTSVFQTIVDIIDFGMRTEEAVNGPKFHHQWLPDELYIEKNFPQATRMALEKMGYKVTERGAIGRTEVIRVLPDGKFEAVADSRGDDAAEGL